MENLIHIIIIITLKMLDSYTASFTQQMEHSSFHWCAYLLFVISLLLLAPPSASAAKEAYMLQIIYYVAYIPEVTKYTTMVDIVYKNTWTGKTL